MTTLPRRVYVRPDLYVQVGRTGLPSVRTPRSFVYDRAPGEAPPYMYVRLSPGRTYGFTSFGGRGSASRAKRTGAQPHADHVRKEACS